MLKRIGASLIIDSKILVNSYNFERRLPVGKLIHTISRLQELGVDEILILNTSHSANPAYDFQELLREFNDFKLSTPIAYGGGIESHLDANSVIRSGADRVVISLKTLLNQQVFFKINELLGEQAIILHLPIDITGAWVHVFGYEIYSLNQIASKIPINWGGEILISSVQQDGAKSPNLQLFNRCAIQLGTKHKYIFTSGFSAPNDVFNALNNDCVNSVAIGNFLHRSELSIRKIKQEISPRIEVR